MYPLSIIVTDPHASQIAAAAVALVSVVYAVRQHFNNNSLRHALRSASAQYVRVADLQDAYKQRALEAEARMQHSEDMLGRLRTMRVMPQVFVWDEEGETDDYGGRDGPRYAGVAIAFDIEDARKKVIQAYMKSNPLQPHEGILANRAFRSYVHARYYRRVCAGFAYEPEHSQLVSELGAYSAKDQIPHTYVSTNDLPNTGHPKYEPTVRRPKAERKLRARLAALQKRNGPESPWSQDHSESPWTRRHSENDMRDMHARVNEIDDNNPINKKPD